MLIMYTGYIFLEKNPVIKLEALYIYIYIYTPHLITHNISTCQNV